MYSYAGEIKIDFFLWDAEGLYIKLMLNVNKARVLYQTYFKVCNREEKRGQRNVDTTGYNSFIITHSKTIHVLAYSLQNL